MKITASNIEHAWIHAQKDKGRAGNVSFDGNDICSYSTTMGRVVVRPTDPNAPGLVLLNARRYSVTTARHQGHIRHAVPSHWIVVNYTPSSGYYSYGDGSPGDVSALIAGQWTEAKKRLSKLQHPTKEGALADLATMRNLQAAARLVGKGLLGVRRFDLDAYESSLPWAAQVERWEHASEVARRRSEGALKAAATRRAEQTRLWSLSWEERHAEQAKKDLERVGKWRAGKYSGRLSVPYGQGHYLRIKGEVVETSGGASIPLEAARLVWGAWSLGRLAVGQHAGAFAVREVTPDYFVAGCTRIDRTEAAALAQAQGWA